MQYARVGFTPICSFSCFPVIWADPAFASCLLSRTTFSREETIPPNSFLKTDLLLKANIPIFQFQNFLSPLDKEKCNANKELQQAMHEPMYKLL